MCWWCFSHNHTTWDLLWSSVYVMLKVKQSFFTLFFFNYSDIKQKEKMNKFTKKKNSKKIKFVKDKKKQNNHFILFCFTSNVAEIINISLWYVCITDGSVVELLWPGRPGRPVRLKVRERKYICMTQRLQYSYWSSSVYTIKGLNNKT